MKKLIFFLLLLVSYSIHSQVITPYIGNAYTITEEIKFKKAIIHFNDGTDVEGIGRLDAILTSQEEVIIFKIEEKDKDEKWTVKDAKGITIISEDEGVKDYVYLKVTKNSFAKFYEVITEGDVTLYKRNKVSKAAGITITKTYTTVPDSETGSKEKVIATKVSPGVTEEHESLIYYVKREKELYPTKIRDNYIKSFAEYMKDCDLMVEKIKNHEYNFSELKDLVDYYNANCGE
jgi:hypothetical protein